jgi:hypothetical protein
VYASPRSCGAGGILITRHSPERLHAFQDNAAKNSQPDIVSASRCIERG